MTDAALCAAGPGSEEAVHHVPPFQHVLSIESPLQPPGLQGYTQQAALSPEVEHARMLPSPAVCWAAGSRAAAACDNSSVKQCLTSLRGSLLLSGPALQSQMLPSLQ